MAENKVNKIELKVELDEQNLPENLSWFASDSPMEEYEKCKAFMLSIWDPNQKNTLKIDLWDKEMSVEEMNYFYYQNLLLMADNFKRATGNEEVSQFLKETANKFADILKMK